MQQSRRWHSSELTCLNPFPSGADTGHRVRSTPPDLSTRPRRAISLAKASSTFLQRRNCLCTPTTEECSQQKAQGEDSDADQSGFQTRTEEDRSEEESYKLTSSGSQTSGARSFPKGGGDVSVQLQTQGFRAGEG
jgi:hypothetical protein